MVNLSSSWDNNRNLLLEALLNLESLPSPDHCQICLEEKTLIRCHDYPNKFFCSSCDVNVHSLLPFHNRDGFVDGFFQAILPTVIIDENGVKQNIGKQICKRKNITLKTATVHVLNLCWPSLFFFVRYCICDINFVIFSGFLLSLWRIYIHVWIENQVVIIVSLVLYGLLSFKVAYTIHVCRFSVKWLWNPVTGYLPKC